MTETYWPSIAAEKLRDLLEEYLITNVPTSDESRASLVVIGAVQKDLSREKIVVEVHENDPDNPENWDHSLIHEDKNEDSRRFRQTIGPKRYYWNRRFTLRVLIFLRGKDRSEAGVIKGQVMTRVERMLLEHNTLDALTDSAGEVAWEGDMEREYGFLSGDNRVPIWRHKVYLVFRTLRKTTP